jgi:hypothetical protein
MTLKTHWHDLDPGDKADYLLNLVCCGCSIRGLAEIFSCTPHTISDLLDRADARECWLKKLAEWGDDFNQERFVREWRATLRREYHRRREPGYWAEQAELQASAK